MTLTPAEQKVRKLARLPANGECANCGTIKKFGFSTVCIKYCTFVCNDCKSSHQAISHRCKSLTMSSWTDAEANELQQKGNDYARRTWLKNAPPFGVGGRPKEGDSVDVFKRFVVDVYERKRYYGEDDQGVEQLHVATAIPLSMPSATIASSTSLQSQFWTPPVDPPVPASVKPPAPPVADLLDFSFPTNTSTAPPTLTAPPTNNNNNGNALFVADFDAFAPAETPAVATTSTATVKNDSFPSSSHGWEGSAPTTASKTPLFSSSSSSFAATIINNNGSHSDFSSGVSVTPLTFHQTAAAPPIASSPAPPSVKKPVMSNSSIMSEKSSCISNMNVPSQQHIQPQQMQQMHQQKLQQQLPGSWGMGMNSMNDFNNNHHHHNMNSGSNNMMMMQQQQQQQRMMMMMTMPQNNYNNMNMMHGMNNGMGVGMVHTNYNNTNNHHHGMMTMMNGSGRGGMSANNPMMMRNTTNSSANRNSQQHNRSSSNNNSMNALDMNMSSMNAWTTGKK